MDIVLDDEESNVVTAGAIVTVNVTLTRNSMGSLIKGETNALKASANVSSIEHDDNEEDKENQDGETEDHPKEPKKPVWQKKKTNKKSGGNKKQANQKKPVAVAKKNTAIAAKPADAEETQTVSERHKELKELPDLEESDDEEGSDGSGSDGEGSSSSGDTHDKVRTLPLLLADAPILITGQ